MRQTCVPCKVTRSTKLRSEQRSPELGLKSMDFHAPENLIFQVLYAAWQSAQDAHR